MIKNRRAAPGHTPDAIMLTRLAPCAYRQPDWQDTNVSLFGSDLEKKIKAAAADGEVQWEGQGEKVGVEVWPHGLQVFVKIFSSVFHPAFGFQIFTACHSYAF